MYRLGRAHACIELKESHLTLGWTHCAPPMPLQREREPNRVDVSRRGHRGCPGPARDAKPFQHTAGIGRGSEKPCTGLGIY